MHCVVVQFSSTTEIYVQFLQLCPCSLNIFSGPFSQFQADKHSCAHLQYQGKLVNRLFVKVEKEGGRISFSRRWWNVCIMVR
jgi:hypothetical protein